MHRFFNPEDPVAKGLGGTLPHWRQEGVLYFVTFRLADSLPQEKLDLFQTERKAWFASHVEPLTEEQKADYHRRFSERFHRWLDAGHGSMILRKTEARQIVQDALKGFEGIRYTLDRFVVASNHVHVLVAPAPDFSLSEILKGWKSYTARALLKLPLSATLRTRPTVWQRESWDHIVRSPQSLERFRAYIEGHREYGELE